MFSCFSRTPTCDGHGHTDRHTTMAYTVHSIARAVKMIFGQYHHQNKISLLVHYYVMPPYDCAVHPETHLTGLVLALESLYYGPTMTGSSTLLISWSTCGHAGVVHAATALHGSVNRDVVCSMSWTNSELPGQSPLTFSWKLLLNISLVGALTISSNTCLVLPTCHLKLRWKETTNHW